MISDSELLHRFSADRDEAAFRQLVERHLSTVYSAALRQVGGDRHLAQDVSQQVFASLARKAKSVASRPSAAGWLCKAARYEARHAVREAQRRRARELAAHPELLGPEQIQAEWERLRPVIDQAICAMPERDREVILLRFFHNLDYPEIGRRLGKTPDAMRFRTDRALEKMRRKLRRAGIDSTATAIALALANRTEATPAGLLGTIVSASTGQALPGQLVASTGAAAKSLGALGTVFGIGVVVTAVILATHECALNLRAQTEKSLAASASQAETQELAAWRKRVAEGRAKARNAEWAVAALKRELAERGQSSVAKPAGTPARTPAGERPAAIVALSQDPAIRSDFEAFFKALYASRYESFLRSRGLTDEEIARFVSAEVHEGSFLIDQVTVDLKPTSISDPDASEAIEQSLDGKLTSGDLTAFTKITPLNGFVQGLAGALAETSSALTAEQGQLLLNSVAQHVATGGPYAAISQVDWPAVIAEAQTFLSPSQMETLQAEASMAAGGETFSTIDPGAAGAFSMVPPSVFEN
jgi:RNA polymerase sigma factor (sigma-70 family)